MIEGCDRDVEGAERVKLADVIFKQAVLALGNNGNRLAGGFDDRRCQQQ